MDYLLPTLFAVATYFLGAIPVGFLVCKAKGINILEQGSGNIGATNVARIAGKKLGVLVFLLDIAKGALPAAVAQVYFQSESWAFAMGMVAVLGHSLSPFLGFKGGKGVATGLGALIGSSPITAGVTFGTFLLVFLVTRFVSLSSLIAALVLVISAFVMQKPAFILGAHGFLCLLIFVRHRQNILRLMNGTEPKFGVKPPQTDSDETSNTASKTE